jgi:hypothetical protein
LLLAAAAALPPFLDDFPELFPFGGICRIIEKTAEGSRSEAVEKVK